MRSVSDPLSGKAELRSIFRRVAPAVGLFFLSPLVAEFLLGNISVSALSALLFLAPMYGGGAILIREGTRRTGRGWPAILLLSAAYAVIEEGLLTQSLFNPAYVGADLLSFTPLPGLGMGAWWTLFVLTLHVVWSMGASIAVIEACVPARATQPWLGTASMALVGALFLLGSTFTGVFSYQVSGFLLSPGQLAGTIITIAVLIAAAFAGPRFPRPTVARPAPNPWLVGLFALAASSLFLGIDNRTWVTVGIYLALDALVIRVVLTWSRRSGWTGIHILALAGGALLTYAWHAFPESPVVGAQGTTDLAGNTVFAIGTLALLTAAARTQRRAAQPGSNRWVPDTRSPD